jgi:hypothetical protein
VPRRFVSRNISAAVTAAILCRESERLRLWRLQGKLASVPPLQWVRWGRGAADGDGGGGGGGGGGVSGGPSVDAVRIAREITEALSPAQLGQLHLLLGQACRHCDVTPWSRAEV